MTMEIHSFAVPGPFWRGHSSSASTDRNRRVSMGQLQTTLLTGATGLLGQFLLADLLRCRHSVAVLARSGRTGSARQRIEQLVQRFETSAQRRLPRPVVLEGELTSAGIGLTESSRDWIRNHCFSVIHSAANLSFKPASEHPDNEPFRTNVEGTRSLVNLCRELGVREFHDISSAYVCGLRKGRILESDGQQGQSFSNDYEQSKLTAEEIVHEAGFESVTVYRPSIVVDPTPGSLQLGDRTIYYAFSVFRLMTQRFGPLDLDILFPSLGLTGEERKNIVPAAWVARTIVEIFRRPELHGQTYHLTNPEGTRLREMLNSFQAVLQPRRATPAAYQLSDGLGDLTGIIHQFVETFTPYFRDDPEFDQTQLKHALTIAQIPNCPRTESSTLHAMALQQMTSRPPAAIQTTNKSLSSWERWLRQHTVSGDFAVSVDEKSTPVCRITLTGPGGGEWTLAQPTAGGIHIVTGEPTDGGISLYTSTEVWNHLLSGDHDIAKDLAAGQVLLESAEPAQALRIVVDLINELRSHSSASHSVGVAPQESGI